MNQIEDTRVFTGGMDLESHDSAIQSNDYREAYNCRNLTTQGRNAGALQNMYGNKLMQSSFLPTGTNVIIGACRDEPNHSIIFFLYNSTNKHGVYEYIPRTDSIVKILDDKSVLNFNLSYRINHANVIGDLIYWTDGYNPPRKINKLKAIAYTNSSGSADYDAYTAITAQILDVIKYPPLLPPDVEYGTDLNYKNNALQGALYQFMYRYIYDDFEYSVCSPVSKNALPEGGVDSFGNVVLSQYSNNFINVPLNTGTDEVKAIDVIVREGAVGHFKQVSRLRKYDDDYNQVYIPIVVEQYDPGDGITGSLVVTEESLNAIYVGMSVKESEKIEEGTYVTSIRFYDRQVSLNTAVVGSAPGLKEIENVYISSDKELAYRYYNNQVGEVTDQDDITRLYDTVPIIAGTQEIIEGNKLLFTDITEGKDNVVIDVKLLHSTESIDNLQSDAFVELTMEEGTYGSPGVDVFELTIEPEEYFQYARYNLKFSVLYSITSELIRVDVSLLAVDATLTDFKTSLASFLDSIYVDGAPYGFRLVVNAFVDGADGKIKFAALSDFSLEFEPPDDPHYSFGYTSNTISEPSWKSGVVQEFGIVYCDDAKRSGGVNVSELAKIYIPLFSELSDINEKLLHDKRIINWEIKHLPPNWAKSYKWVFAPKTVLRADYWISAIEDATEVDLFPISETNKGVFPHTLIDVNSGIANVLLSNPDFIIPAYVFQAGDRIRFISNAYPTINPLDPQSVAQKYIQENLDFVIKGQTQDGKIVLDIFDWDSYGINVNSIVEIYRSPKSLGDDTQSLFFYEFGEDYEIYEISGVKYHRGGVNGVDQTASVNATGEFRGGDIYIKQRIDPSKANNASPIVNFFPVEEQNFSDYYLSDVHSFGNVFIPDSKMRRLRYTTGIRFSDVYYEGGINGLSTFRAKNFDRLNERYGPINRVIQVGYTIKFFQTTKTVSVYNERGELSQAIGTGQLSVLLDQTLGSKRTPEVSYGTTNPESVIKVDRVVYFFDRINQAICRDDANGPDSITNVMMRSYMAGLVESFGNNAVYCHTVEDSRHGDIYFSFQYVTTRMHIATLVYNIYDQRWKTFVNLYDIKNFGMDCGIDCDSSMITFMHGNVYLHNVETVDRCTFYGVKYRQRVKFVANLHPGTNKVFRYLQIGCNSFMGDINDIRPEQSLWEAWEDGSIYIPPNNTYPFGQWSRLRKERMELKEGIYYADFLRNSRTRRNIDNLQDLFDGDQLMGRWIQIDLSNESDADAALEFVKVISDVSKKPV